MLQTMRPGQRVIVFTTTACLIGMILKAIWPGWILPEASFTLYAAILILAHGSEPKIGDRWDEGFDWLISILALTFLPVAAGVLDIPLWKAMLIDAVFSGAVILTLDSISRRAELRRTGRVSFLINGALLLLAVQGFEHMFY